MPFFLAIVLAVLAPSAALAKLPALAERPAQPLRVEYAPSETALKTVFAGFQLVQGEAQGKLPCKQECLLVHRDSDQLRAVLAGDTVRMAYRNPDRTLLPYPHGYAHVGPLERAEIVDSFRAFFESELAVAIHAFVWTTPGLFNWTEQNFAAALKTQMVSAASLDSLFRGKKPALFPLMSLRAQGHAVSFSSDGNGTLYLDIIPHEK
jgi:hypothetical protein